MLNLPTACQNCGNKDEMLLVLLNERERKYDQRADRFDKALDAANIAVKDALQTSNALIANASATVDKRFEQSLEAVEKATIKSEASTEKRFEAVNEFRKQLADQQLTFARKAEVDIRFDSLENKLDTAISQLATQKGSKEGVNLVWGGVAFALMFSVQVAIGIITVFKHV
jgi:deoxyribodipyrimidine photolyase